MRISACNVLEGTVKEVKKGAAISHVLIDVKGLTVTSSITNEAVDELGLKTGTKVKAIIIPSDVMVAVGHCRLAHQNLVA
jgi:molybdopterin-binding protein